MGLARYRQKRDFRRTNEPRGRRARSGRRRSFVVHEHHARRLHWDLRLEIGGVLASWAVPKGPSLDPAVRRLAVHVEDHPLDYGAFQGSIPEGNYGAGRVRIWDRGTWIPDGPPEAGLRSGRLTFRLEGRRLRGSWRLVRLEGRGKGTGKEPWLLVKQRDEAARAGHVAEPVLRAAQPPARRQAARRTVTASTRRARAASAPKRRASRAPRRGPPLPEFVPPQLATLVSQPPAGEEWVHEIKLDGYRLQCRIEGAQATLRTRSGLDWTRRFPALAAEAAALGAAVDGLLLDGEVVVLDARGASQFGALQDALAREDTSEAVYFAFDLLYLGGRDVREHPLGERKQALSRLLERVSPRIRYLDHVVGRGGEFLERACEFALEGSISKRVDALYRAGRSLDWRKSKCLQQEEFVIVGYTAPGGTRTGLGALVLATRDGTGALVPAGRVGTGFSDVALRTLRERLQPLETDRSAFARAPASRGVTWVRPDLVAQVRFVGRTRDGLVRHASFDGLREDKPAREVRRERVTPSRGGCLAHRPVAGRGGRSRPAGPGGPALPPGEAVVAGVRITHPERVVFPDAGVTKVDLARYYEKAAKWALPHLAGRPLSLVRCPDGVHGDCFFQKHAAAGPHRRSVSVGTGARDGDHVVVDDAAGLVSLVQMGGVEIHPWGARAGRLERPDRMTLDLDPGPGVTWTEVAHAARSLRRALRALGLRGFLKTTGGKGLHVVVPLAPTHTWDEVKAFARALAERFVSEEPDRYVSRAAKALRHGRILIDWLRNARGATAVGAYSARARPGAPVAVPVAWSNLRRDLRGDAWNVQNLPARLARLRNDPWRGFSSLRQSLSVRAWKALGVERPPRAPAMRPVPPTRRRISRA